MILAKVLCRRALHLSVLALAVMSGGLIASGAASASNAIPVSQVCSGGGQLCNTIAQVPLDVTGAGALKKANFGTGPLTCSQFRIHYLVDGTEVAVSGFVGPKQKTGFVSLGFIGHGNHVVGMRAEGELGGCNIGNLLSWGGKVRIKNGP